MFYLSLHISIVPLVCILVFGYGGVNGWTHKCPQSNLEELCKCSPGEQCCLCPNKRPLLSHTHFASGINAEIIGGDPCQTMVSPNGCSVGGICPSCNDAGGVGFGKHFTNDQCVDEPSCPRLGLTRTLCATFDDIRHRCPLSCGDCCLDDDECRGLPLNDALCSSFAHIRKQCRSTCGTCDLDMNTNKAEAACISSGGIVKNGKPPTTGAYPPKIRTSAKKFCWKEGLFTQPQASAWCSKLSGRLPVIHAQGDNVDVGKAAGALHSIWLGLVRTPKCKSNTNRCFKWENEGALGVYHNWYTNKWDEPNNVGGEQNCVYMSWPDKQWLDGDCEDLRNTLCELPPY